MINSIPLRFLKVARCLTVLAALVAADVVSADTHEIINSGVAGNNSRNLLGRIKRDVLPHNPDLVIIGVGTNDAINSNNALPPDLFVSNLGKIISEFRTHGVQIILLTPPPVYDQYVLKRHDHSFFETQSPSDKIREYRTLILTVGKNEGIPVVDVYALFNDQGVLGEERGAWLRNRLNSGVEDGVHPSPAGYNAIAIAVKETMDAAGMANCHKIVCFGDSITYGIGTKDDGKTTGGESYPARLQDSLN